MLLFIFSFLKSEIHLFFTFFKTPTNGKYNKEISTSLSKESTKPSVTFDNSLNQGKKYTGNCKI